MNSSFATCKRRTPALVAALALIALACATSSARAASSVSIAVGADPVESIATQLGVTGSADDTMTAYVTYKPTGGTGCGANYDADTGDRLVYSGYYLSQAGPFSRSDNITFSRAGDYLVCAWLQKSATVVATTSKVITIRPPKLSLAISAPASVNQGDTFPVATTTQAEAARSVYVYSIVDTGRGCPVNAAATYDARIDTINSGSSVVGGPTTTSTNETISTAGAYLVCGYIHYKSMSDPPQAIASAAVTVLAPPPPPPACVVPPVLADEPLAAAKGRLTAAACTPGRVRYVASARYARGSVFKFGTAPGTTLGNAAAVDLYVSSGAPCIVPAMPAGHGLATVKGRLLAAGCTPGTVTYRHSSRRKRGRVIALSQPKGTRLAPRTVVAIVVSRGR